MVRCCVVVWILSWSFQSYVLRRLVIAPSALPRNHRDPSILAKELIWIWYGSYCRPHLLVFYAMLLFRSPHFKRAVVCPLSTEIPQDDRKLSYQTYFSSVIRLRRSWREIHYWGLSWFIPHIINIFHLDRNQFAVAENSASNCPSVTSFLGYPPKGSVRLLLCVFSILRAVNSIGQYSLM